MEALSLQNSSLSWRWEPSHTEMCQDKTSEIGTLSKDDSVELNGRCLSIVESTKVACATNTDRGSKKISEWLASLGINGSLHLSYDEKTALVTPAELFIEYWDDFLYPSTDNVFITTDDGSWILQFFHYERLEFRTISAT